MKQLLIVALLASASLVSCQTEQSPKPGQKLKHQTLHQYSSHKIKEIMSFEQIPVATPKDKGNMFAYVRADYQKSFMLYTISDIYHVIGMFGDTLTILKTNTGAEIIEKKGCTKCDYDLPKGDDFRIGDTIVHLVYEASTDLERRKQDKYKSLNKK